MNICLISQEYPPETNLGGIATYTQIFARQLVKMGERVHVVTLSPKGNEYTANDMGVTVHRISWKPQKVFTGFKKLYLNLKVRQNHPLLGFSQRVYEKVAEIHKKDNFDVIEAPDTCAQAFYINKFIRGPKKVVRFHTPFFWVRQLNNMPDTPEHLIRDRFERIQAQDATVLTSPTRAMADVVKHCWGIDNIHVIPNFFNLKDYTPDWEVYNQHLKNENYIIFYGRLEYRKGVHILAQALVEVFDRIDNIKVAFVGNDSIYNNFSMKEKIQNILTRYGDRAIFISNIGHNSLYPLIEKSRFVVLPSLWENFPYTCLEAMALGKVVIATTGSGFSEIIDDCVNGFLCPTNDVSALSKLIIDCIENVELDKIGNNALVKAGKFDTVGIVKQMLEFYKF